MHPNRKFHIESREEMAALVRAEGFGMVVVQTDAGLRAVHVPVLLTGNSLRFHVSRGNAVHAALAEGCEALFVVTGAHAYVSPHWYGLEGRVPTWSYVAVELNGKVEPLSPEALVALLDDMSAEQEERLRPKKPWTRDEMSTGRFESLLTAIAGFEMHIADWRGTAKIDQDKPAEVRSRIAAALRGRGEEAMAEFYSNSPPGNPGEDRG
jgi:transcriptional regulator